MLKRLVILAFVLGPPLAGDAALAEDNSLSDMIWRQRAFNVPGCTAWPGQIELREDRAMGAMTGLWQYDNLVPPLQGYANQPGRARGVVRYSYDGTVSGEDLTCYPTQGGGPSCGSSTQYGYWVAHTDPSGRLVVAVMTRGSLVGGSPQPWGCGLGLYEVRDNGRALVNLQSGQTSYRIDR